MLAGFRAAVVLVIVGSPGLVWAEGPPTFAGPTMGTTYRVRLGQELMGVSLSELRSEVEVLLAEIDRQMSTYNEDSVLARFNRSSSTEWFAVPADLETVVRAALDVARQSGGAFDVTVAPLVELWGFGPKGRPGRVPAADEIARARRAVGPGLIDARLDPPALRKRHADVRLDLNGIAPGFAVDRIAGCLERHQVRNYLIELGGEIRTRGRAADGRRWRVGIERPTKRPSGVQLAIELGDGAVSTSGDYRRSFEHAGKRYAHIIDPRTGWPAALAVTSVSVVAEECMLADAWTKPLMVLGPEDGKRLAEDRGLAAYFVLREIHETGEVLRGMPTARFTQQFLGPESQGSGSPFSASNRPPPEISPETPSGHLRDNTLQTVVGSAVALIVLSLAVATRTWRWRKRSGEPGAAPRPGCPPVADASGSP